MLHIKELQARARTCTPCTMHHAPRHGTPHAMPPRRHAVTPCSHATTTPPRHLATSPPRHHAAPRRTPRRAPAPRRAQHANQGPNRLYSKESRTAAEQHDNRTPSESEASTDGINSSLILHTPGS
eukprot:1265194-Prymnesium_polylepis.1